MSISNDFIPCAFLINVKTSREHRMVVKLVFKYLDKAFMVHPIHTYL